MSVDSLFPALAVVSPFFEEACIPASEGQPTWAGEIELPRTILHQAEPVLRVLAMAGWRVTRLQYCTGHDTNAANTWCTIDLAERTISYDPRTEESPVHRFEHRDIWFAMDIQQIAGYGETWHAEPLAQDVHASSDAYRKWVVETQQDTKRAVLHFMTPAQQGGTEVRYADQAEDFAYKRGQLDEAINAFVQVVKADLLVKAGHQDTHYPAALALNPMDLPGLTWLFFPSTWFADAALVRREDLFVDQLMHHAEKIATRFDDDDMFFELVARTLYPTVQSLEFLAQDVIRKNRNENTASAARIMSRKSLAAESKPLKDAVSATGYFDFICMLVHTGRINPPQLPVSDIVGNWEDPTAEDEDAGALVPDFGEWKGEQMVTLNMFGKPAVHLFQTRNKRVLDLTPPILDNAAWEYRGQGADGRHVIGLTLGRGVRVVQDGQAGPLKLDIFPAQSAGDFRRPVSRPANLEAVEERDPLALSLYDIPSPIDITSPLFHAPLVVDDLSATAAQRLEHDLLHAQQSYVAHIPRDLLHSDREPDAETDAPVPIGQQLSNFFPDKPPTFLVRQCEDGSVRFEWYREGVSTDPTTPGSDGKKNGTLTWAMTLTPNNLTSGDFGFCWALDYGYLTHEPLIDEDLASEVFYASFKDSILNTLGTLLIPGYNLLPSSVIPKPNNVHDRLSQTIQPYGVAFLRIWYSGNVHIDIQRTSDSDASFFAEMVKVANVMDLPQQGTRLPARSVRYGDYVPKVTDPSIIEHTGIWSEFYAYHALLDPNAAPIPEWKPEDMPAHFVDESGHIDYRYLTHVCPAESHVNGVLGNIVPTMMAWSDVTHFIVRDRDWDAWVSGNLSSKFSQYTRISGEIKIDPTIEWIVFTIGAEMALGFIPYVGDAADVAEFLYAYETGQDKWGEPVPTWQLYLMGAAAAIPFASSGMVKGGIAIGSDLIGDIPSTFMRGAGVEDLLNLIPTNWRAFGETAESVRAIPIRRVTSEAGEQVLDPDASLTAIKQGLKHPETLGELAELAGKSLQEIVAKVEPDLSLIVRIDGEDIAIRIPVLEKQFLAAKMAAKNSDEFTVEVFLNSRRYTTGISRVILEMFGAIKFKGGGLRKALGNAKSGVNWPGLGDIVDIAAGKRTATQLAGDLGAAKAVENGLAQLVRQIDIDYVTRYGDTVKTLLAEFKRAGLLGDIVSSKKHRSIGYVIAAMTRCSEMLTKIIMDEGLDVATELGTSGKAKALGGMSEVDQLRHSFIIEAFADFIKRAISQTGYEHGYRFEVAISLVLRKKFQLGRLRFFLQAEIGGKSGPDFVAAVRNGFAIIQAKALKSAGKQFGTVAHQDNMFQTINDLTRMFANKVGPPPGNLLDDLRNGEIVDRFSGLFIHMVDLDYLAKHVPDRSRKLFDYSGGEIEIPDEALALLSAEKVARLRALSTETDMIAFNTFEAWEQAAKVLGEDAFEHVAKRAMELQAFEIKEMIEILSNFDTLNAVLLRGDGAWDSAKAERVARSLAGYINAKRPKGAAKISAEDLLKAGEDGKKSGPETVFEKLGLEVGWWETLTGGSGVVPDVRVLDLKTLDEMSVDEFGGAL